MMSACFDLLATSDCSLSTNQTLIIDWRVTPIRAASLSREFTTQEGKSTFRRFCFWFIRRTVDRLSWSTTADADQFIGQLFRLWSNLRRSYWTALLDICTNSGYQKHLEKRTLIKQFCLHPLKANKNVRYVQWSLLWSRRQAHRLRSQARCENTTHSPACMVTWAIE